MSQINKYVTYVQTQYEKIPRMFVYQSKNWNYLLPIED